MLTTVTPENRAEWLEERNKGIGASEAAAAIGLSPHESPLELYLRKTGALGSREQTEAMELGTLLEPVIAELYTRRTGRRIVETQRFFKSEETPYLFATLDGINSDGEPVEFKAVSGWGAQELGEEGTDEIPSHWLIQAHQQMLLSGTSGVDFAILVNGQRFRLFRAVRDEALLDLMLPDLEAFWGNVQRREPPEAETFDARILAALNPECHGEVELAMEFDAIAARYEELGLIARGAEAEREGLKVSILRAMGTAQWGILPSGQRIKRYLERCPERTNVVRPHTRHYLRLIKERS